MMMNFRSATTKNLFTLALSVLWIVPTLGGGQTEPAASDEGRGRTPAQPCPAEMSGILLGEGREAMEHPEEIIDAMGLEDGDIVADLGSGPGYYTLRLAKRVAPHGVVFAVDIQQAMLDQLKTRMDEAEITNIYSVLGAFEDPYLPKGKIDWILLVDAYHEFGEPEAMLARMREALAPDGKIALLEYRTEQDPATLNFPIPPDHKMSIDQVMSEWTEAGFELVELREFLPSQHYFIFQKASDEPAPWHDRAEILEVKVGETVNVTSLGGFTYFSGQPAEPDFRLFADRGVRTVINLRTDPEIASLGFDEKAAVEAAGMTYLHAPMGREPISDADLKKVMAALDKSENSRVLLHCASSNRVGAVWALHKALSHGLSADDALAQGRSAGMKAPALETGIRERLKGAGR